VAIGVELEGRDEITAAYREYRQGKEGHNNADATKTDASEDDGDDELPPLRFGTFDDELPEGWVMKPWENLGNFYAGNMSYMTANMNVFPTALPNDGLLDMVCINGDVPRLRALELAKEVETGGLFNQKDVRYLKVSGYRIIPREKEGYISVDGERIPFGGFQAEIHQGLGCVLSKSGTVYEVEGPKDK